MTIIELANELNKLVEAGYGDAKAIVGIPTLYISDDGDLYKDNDADVTEELYFWSDHFLREDGNKNEVRIIEGNYIEKEDCWDEDEEEENGWY